MSRRRTLRLLVTPNPLPVRQLAERSTGEERDILALVHAEEQHELHWPELLGDDVGPPRRSSLRTRLLVSWPPTSAVCLCALMQRAEDRSPYESDADATDTMRPTSGSR